MDPKADRTADLCGFRRRPGRLALAGGRSEGNWGYLLSKVRRTEPG